MTQFAPSLFTQIVAVITPSTLISQTRKKKMLSIDTIDHICEGTGTPVPFHLGYPTSSQRLSGLVLVVVVHLRVPASRSRVSTDHQISFRSYIHIHTIDPAPSIGTDRTRRRRSRSSTRGNSQSSLENKSQSSPHSTQQCTEAVSTHLVTIAPEKVLRPDVLVRVLDALLQRREVLPVLPVLVPQVPSIETTEAEDGNDDAASKLSVYRSDRLTDCNGRVSDSGQRGGGVYY